MASPSIFSMRVIRCPSCGARLPVQPRVTVLRCEYCDAQVEVARAAPPSPPPQPPHYPQHPNYQPPQLGGPPAHVARPRYSGFAWVVMLIPLAAMGTGVFTALRAASLATAPVTTTSVPVRAPTAVPVVAPRNVATPHVPSTTPSPPSTPTPSTLTPTPKPPATPPRSVQPRPSSEPKAPEGPVISVEEARKQLEPKIRACMQTAKVHHVLAYMGNAKVGPVAVLPDSRTHVDGKKTALGKTTLGRCFDAAGKSVRTAAFKSNYVRLDVRNDGVPDPLGALPSKANPAAVREVIAGFDDEVKACGRKHGAEGRKASLQLTIDGPTGKLVSLSAGDLPAGFMKCARSIYARASFAKVQPTSYQVTYSISL